MADPITMTQEELDALVADKLASAKAEGDAAFQNLWKEAKAAKAKLRDYDGIDPERARAFQKKADDAEAAAAAARGDFTVREKNLVEAHTKEREGDRAKITKRDAVIRRRVAEAELRAAIARKKGDADLLLPHALPYVEVEETDDDFVPVLKEKGSLLVADGTGKPMDFDMFVEQRLMAKFPGAFDGSGSSGGGAPKSAAGGSGGVRVIPEGTPWVVKPGRDDIADMAKGTATTK